MKKILSLIFILLLTVSLVGCGKDKVTEVKLTQQNISELPESMSKPLKDFMGDETYQAFEKAGDLFLFASRGEKNSKGYEINFDKAGIKDEKLYVEVSMEDPEEKTATGEKNYPIVLAKVTGDKLPDKVVFVEGDDYDKVLAEMIVLPFPEIQESLASLYFGTKEGFLRKETRSMEGEITPLRGKEVIEELIKGTKEDDDTLNVLPKGTKVLNYEFDADSKTATIDFSKHIHGVQGSKGESLAVYAVTNTLTEIPGIQNVQILVEGEKVDSLAGHVYLQKPLQRDPVLFEGNTLK